MILAPAPLPWCVCEDISAKQLSLIDTLQSFSPELGITIVKSFPLDPIVSLILYLLV